MSVTVRYVVQSVACPPRHVAMQMQMEERLIEQVKNHPAVYDKSSSMYTSQKHRDQNWLEIAKAVQHPDVEYVKKRWRTMRDSFIKIHRSVITNPNYVVKWYYYAKLLFLIPHIESRDLKDESEMTESFIDANSKRLLEVDHDPLEEVHFSKRVREDEPDSDEQFLLSCLPTLKRLGRRENAIARIRIQQVLFELEFGEDGGCDTKAEIMH